ncbi:TRAP transporter small permease [Thioclava sp. SK-1]|uniref:TRAP transporter small permease n=1 Tax=Thioclava sp. SK-1 TaxID=1889770 RepID=UPI001C400BDA|nr:TRAP transporter small permease [Thioclava sp. SK-1]
MAVGGACALLLVAMVCVLSWQVISRYVLGAPSTFSEEVLRFGVIWLSLLGAAYATGAGTHMTIDLLRELSSGWKRRMLETFVPISLILFAGFVLVLGGVRGVQIAGVQTSPVLGIPMKLIYASLPTSGVLIIGYSLLNLIDILRQKCTQPDAVARALALGE